MMNSKAMEKSLIFLDFDGVLNTEQYQAELAISGKSGRDTWGPLFDLRAVENLRVLIEETGAMIVVTSTWRYIHGLMGLKDMWKARSLPGNILSILPCDSLMPARGEEIAEYLKKHKDAPYVILDDIDEFEEMQIPNFIKVNPVKGLSAKDAQKATAILQNRHIIES